jgi:hypothetical protein
MRHQIPDDKRTIVLSATANESIYMKSFKDMEFYDLSMVQLKGSIRQFSNRSFSRRSFRKEETQKMAVKIAEYAGNSPVISYKGIEFQKYYTNPFRHIEDIMGTNELAGQEVVIPATPQKPPYFYRLWAATLGIYYSQEDTHWGMQNMVRNGHEFRMMSFSGKELQDIHCHFVQSSLVQAVGRPRLLEHDVTAHVFSTYPVPGATHFDLKDMMALRELDKLCSMGRVINMTMMSGSMAS